MCRPARPLHEPGNDRAFERLCYHQAASCGGGLIDPATPVITTALAAVTPLLGTRPRTVMILTLNVPKQICSGLVSLVPGTALCIVIASAAYFVELAETRWLGHPY